MKTSPFSRKIPVSRSFSTRRKTAPPAEPA
jgi:hypothetical protein